VQHLSESSDRQFQQHLINGSNALGIAVSTAQSDLMRMHAKELIAWNKKTNLTAITDWLTVAEKHFIDSIAAVSFLKKGRTLMDFGSGGGFPGIPIKIMNPSLTVTLVDASRKKVNFLKHVIRMLGLEGIEAIHARVEDLHGDLLYQNRFDAVISRAFTNLEGFTDLAVPFLNAHGTIYAMKGKNAVQEINPAILKTFELKTDHYQLPFERSDRYMICLSSRL
jgi:16S rRNA (guanine527-N7)-methyltransferase